MNILQQIKDKVFWFCHLRSKCSCFIDKCCGYYWGNCCAIHDYYYLNQDKHNLTKSQVDKILFDCIKNRVNVFLAILMYIGNKTFSWYYWRKFKK